MRGSRMPVSSRYSDRLAALASLKRMPAAVEHRSPRVRSSRCTRSASSPATIEPTCGSASSERSAPDPKSRPYTRATPRSGRIAGGDRDGAQRRRLARAARAVDEHGAVAVGLERHRRLQLPLGHVGEPEQDVGVAVHGERLDVDGASRGRRATGGAAPGCRPLRRRDERSAPCASGRWGRDRRRALATRPRRRASHSVTNDAEAELGHLDLGRRRPRRSSSRRRRRTGTATSRPGPVFAMPRPGIDGSKSGGHRVADDVARVRLVGHAQRDAEVGVRPQVVLDDAGRALGRQDEVQAERAAALGDVDDAVDELGHLPREGGELVDDEHQAGGVSGSWRFSSSSRSLAFLRLRRCSRWCSSARRLVSARRTRCGLRSVTSPTECGRSTQSANAEPPL